MGWIWQEKRRPRMEQKNIAEQKREARAQARARLAGCTPEDTARWGGAMFEFLRVLPVWNTARTVMCFVSTAAEPDTQPLLQAALREGRTLCLPRQCEGGWMEAHRVAALFALRPGPHGILEPPYTLPVVDPAAIDLIVAPCLAAAPNGARLGHGGGFYDRFFARSGAARVVFCPSAAVFPRLPAGEFDLPADLVITERGIL